MVGCCYIQYQYYCEVNKYYDVDFRLADVLLTHFTNQRLAALEGADRPSDT